MTQEKKAYIDTLLDGGYTHLWDSTINPTEGYIVGGVTEPTTMKLDAVATSIAYRDAMQYAEFKELWDKYYTLLDDKFARLMMGCGIGTWVHEGQIYFDIVQHINELDIATKIAKRRGEIAIYDCKNQKEILL